MPKTTLYKQEPTFHSIQSYMQWSPRYETEKQTLIFDDDIQLILDLIHDKFFNFIYISEKSPLKQPSKFDKNLINLPLILDLAVIFPIPNKSKHQYKFEKSKFILKIQEPVQNLFDEFWTTFARKYVNIWKQHCKRAKLFDEN